MHCAMDVARMLYGRSWSCIIDIDEKSATYEKIASGPGEPGREEYDVGGHCLWSSLVDSDRLWVRSCLSQ